MIDWIIDLLRTRIAFAQVWDDEAARRQELLPKCKEMLAQGALLTMRAIELARKYWEVDQIAAAREADADAGEILREYARGARHAGMTVPDDVHNFMLGVLY